MSSKYAIRFYKYDIFNYKNDIKKLIKKNKEILAIFNTSIHLKLFVLVIHVNILYFLFLL